jgi:hypothetical protein
MLSRMPALSQTWLVRFAWTGMPAAVMAGIRPGQQRAGEVLDRSDQTVSSTINLISHRLYMSFRSATNSSTVWAGSPVINSTVRVRRS